ncbi:hypothetical protein JTB14_028127 [Gonioctena quinquepunctata]|nr:hypothetical protein JTB14_028127 [Gonioctena quinquepunctata]
MSLGLTHANDIANPQIDRGGYERSAKGSSFTLVEKLSFLGVSLEIRNNYGRSNTMSDNESSSCTPEELVEAPKQVTLNLLCD